MAALARISLILLLIIATAKSGFIPSPCDEMTYGVPAGQVYNVNPSCTNGSISWSYPMDILRLFFAPADVKDYKFAVCIESYVNESSFDVLDVTKGDKQPCRRISDTEVCTGYHINGVIADVEPKGPMRYMDEIRYRAVTTEPKPQ
ncbi:hypothetical protein CHS0354_003308 [Potamilus streckersoni]|uniref:Uncharacterized protein n=1 Tax=Potamilus streckersoni TaxID=2493646 RepID=A0AAE0S5T1_9BIVA|nr:hypothetical protein CHS0354_003308 [Potamilus streckersoni]